MSERRPPVAASGAEAAGGGEEEGHEDHPGARPEGDGSAGDAGEGGRARLLRDEQTGGGEAADLSAQVHRPTQPGGGAALRCSEAPVPRGQPVIDG